LEKAPESKAAIHRRLPLLIPLLVLFLSVVAATAVIQHPATGWNVNTRLALVFAVADMGTLAIDDYHGEGMPTETGDKAFFEGRYYSDKIFGVSLLALPVYWVGRTMAGESLPFAVGHWLCRLGAVSIPAGASVVLMLLLMMRLGAPPRRALVATLLVFYGSIWFGYSTIFFPYAPALACALGALYLVFFPPANRLTILNCLAIGFLLGYALLCELTMAFLVTGIGFVWLLRLADQSGLVGLRAYAEMAGERTRILHTVAFAAIFWVGVLLPLSLFAVYCHAIFGKLTIPYQYEVSDLFREGMAQGVMGITAPKLGPLYYLTVHPYRGLFFWTPLLLLAVVGCVLATRQYGKRCMVGWLGVYTGVAYLLFNAGYYMWWGGWSMGPRFLIPMIPVVGLGLGELLREGKLSAFEKHAAWAKPVRIAVAVLGVIGMGLSYPLSISEPQTPQGQQTETLLSASISDGLAVPQFFQLQAVYTGWLGAETPLSPRRPPEAASRLANYLSIFLYTLLLLILPAVIVWRLLPVSIPGVHRRDYPFATVDGAAAPPPPKRVA
jgi:hypothetical protein